MHLRRPLVPDFQGIGEERARLGRCDEGTDFMHFAFFSAQRRAKCAIKFGVRPGTHAACRLAHGLLHAPIPQAHAWACPQPVLVDEPNARRWR